jgi:transcriptional regulator GlxA family with amidase domain
MAKLYTTSPGDRSAPPAVPLKRPAPPQQVTFLIVPRFNLIELVALIEPMRVANYLSPFPLYQWEITSFDGRQIEASNGFTIEAAPPDDRKRRDDIIFVLASWGAETYQNREVTNWLRRQWRDGVRICSVEMATYILARAGMLKGRKVAMHFAYAPGFEEEFPDIDLVDQIFTRDDKLLSCAGSFASVDLMLDLIREHHGEGLLSEIADQLLISPPRAPATPQRRGLGNGIENLPPIIRQTILLMEEHLSEPLEIPAIAAALGLSQRQLERTFKQTVGCTVVQFGLLLRLQHARALLIGTRQSIRQIATASGFNTLSHFAHAFRRCFGRRPSEYRQAWPKSDPSPHWPGSLTKYLEMLQHRTALSVRTRRNDRPG